MTELDEMIENWISLALTFLVGFTITGVIPIWKSHREYVEIEKQRRLAALRSPSELGLYE